MKRQVFSVLNYLLEQDKDRETLRKHIDSLKMFYDFVQGKRLKISSCWNFNNIKDLRTC